MLFQFNVICSILLFVLKVSQTLVAVFYDSSAAIGDYFLSSRLTLPLVFLVLKSLETIPLSSPGFNQLFKVYFMAV